MSDILISLVLLSAFGGAWAALIRAGGFDWLADKHVAAARRMLATKKFAFDGEVHA